MSQDNSARFANAIRTFGGHSGSAGGGRYGKFLQAMKDKYNKPKENPTPKKSEEDDDEDEDK